METKSSLQAAIADRECRIEAAKYDLEFSIRKVEDIKKTLRDAEQAVSRYKEEISTLTRDIRDYETRVSNM